MQKFILLNIYTRSSRKVTVWNRRSEKLVEYETNQIKQHRHQTKWTTQLAGNMGCEPNGVEKATKKLGQAGPFTTRGCAAPGRWYMAWSFWFCLEHLLHRRCSSSRVRLHIAGAQKRGRDIKRRLACQERGRRVFKQLGLLLAGRGGIKNTATIRAG
jgi:hypothetical protein